MDNFQDKSWWHDKESLPLRERGLRLKSCYIKMPDGVKIATDIYLPADLKPDEKFPAVFHQTRLIRRFKLRLAFKYFIENSKKYFYKAIIRRFINSSYAVVTIDQRATGASFGERSMQWTEGDPADAYAVLDWITSQPWSDGRVVLIGSGTSALSAELLMAKIHPSVKAAVFSSSPFDIYTDMICPGGVKNSMFIFYWLFYNYYVNKGEIPSQIPELQRLFLSLAAKGAAKPGFSLFSKLGDVMKKRNEGFNHEDIKKYIFRDDYFLRGPVENISPHFHLRELNASEVPVLSISGYFDGAYALGAIKRFMNIQNKGSRLILGKWANNKALSILPFSFKRDDSDFDHVAEAIRFMNYHLKGIDNGISSEEPVHYYTKVENKWNSSPLWPPPDTKKPKIFYLSSNNTAIDNPSEKICSEDKIRFNYRSTSGERSRWTSLTNKDSSNVSYIPTPEQDDLSLIYATAPFEEDFEITGSPVISLYLKSSIPDIQLFVYLADMRSDGVNVYITEGIFRTLHMKINNLKAQYEQPYPNHTYLRQDASYLSASYPSLVSFSLLPVSYLLRKSHSLRIRITGSDKNNFDIIGPAPEVAVSYGLDFPSCLKLPGKTINN